jgi:hypothetical protein
MSEEHDSWFKAAFGVDLGDSVSKLKEEAGAVVGQVAGAVGQVVQGVQGAVEGVVDGITGAATAVAKKVGSAVSPSGSGATDGGVGGGTGSFPLKGSVGRGGQNAPDDVRAVQGALGVAVDGQCGGQTFAAIEAFQRNMGMAKPDGRVDAGGATERALTGGAPTPAVAESGSTSLSPASGVLDVSQAAGGAILDLMEDGVDAATAAAQKVVEAAQAALSGQGLELDDGGVDGGPGDAGPPDGGPADAGTRPDPSFVDVDKPFNVRADDPQEFVSRGNEHLAQGAAGHMQTDPLSVASADTDSKGRVTRSNLVVRTTTVRPHWVAGRPIGDEKVVIEQAEALIQGHEERHRDIMKKAMESAVKEMLGKSRDDADKVLTKWLQIVDKQQDALDAREGRIEIVQSGGRMTGARLVPR